MIAERNTVRLNVLRNALYHTARRRVLERWNRVFNFLIVLLGAAAVSEAVSTFGLPGYLVGLAVTIVGSLQLVFDFGRQARDHQALQRDYYALLAEIEAEPDATADHCAIWISRMMRITADEPPVLRAIDAKAYNDALDALGASDSSERLRIPPLHRLLGGLLSFDGYSYRKISEIAASR